MPSAADFFSKYALLYPSQRIDRDLVTQGIQNHSIIKDELLRDFNALSFEDRYIVLDRLIKSGDQHTSKLLVGYEQFAKRWFEEGANKFTQEPLVQMSQKLEATSDVWEQRYIVLSSTFTFETSVEEYLDAWDIDNQNRFQFSATLRNKFMDGLKLIYQGFGAAIFDSDADGAFDDADPTPLNSDNRLNVEDPPEVGKQVSNERFEVKRTGENSYELGIKIKVCASPDGNKKEIEKNYLSPEFLANLKAGVEAAFAKTLEGGKFSFALKVEFEVTSSPDGNTVMFTDKDIRAHSQLWDLELMQNSDKVLHEVLHLLGEPDTYHEPIVFGGIRDFTFKPGFSIRGKELIMSCAKDPKLPQVDAVRVTNNILQSMSEKIAPQKKTLSGSTERDLAAETAMQAIYEKRDVKLAQKIFWKVFSTESAEDNLLFYQILLHNGMRQQSNGWFLTNVFQKLDLRSSKDRTLLERQINALLRSRSPVPAEYHEALIKAYPLNIDYRMEYAATLFKLDRPQEAKEQLGIISAAYTYSSARGLYPQLGWNDVMEIFAEVLECMDAGKYAGKALRKLHDSNDDGKLAELKDYITNKFPEE